MKYLIIPYIALGLVLSLAFGIEYKCEGEQLFPTYYGSPFVFKKKSLASSMEYFYSVSGLVFNILTWSVVLFLLDKLIQSIIKKKAIRIAYKVVIGILIIFTTLNIAMDTSMMGRGFDKVRNYWYWDMDKEAEDWDVICDGEFVMFLK